MKGLKNKRGGKIGHLKNDGKREERRKRRDGEKLGSIVGESITLVLKCISVQAGMHLRQLILVVHGRLL